MKEMLELLQLMEKTYNDMTRWAQTVSVLVAILMISNIILWVWFLVH